MIKLEILIYDPINRRNKNLEINLKPQFKNDDIIYELIEQNKKIKEENKEMLNELKSFKLDVEMFKEIFGLNDAGNPQNQQEVENNRDCNK